MACHEVETMNLAWGFAAHPMANLPQSLLLLHSVAPIGSYRNEALLIRAKLGAKVNVILGAGHQIGWRAALLLGHMH